MSTARALSFGTRSQTSSISKGFLYPSQTMLSTHENVAIENRLARDSFDGSKSPSSDTTSLLSLVVITTMNSSDDNANSKAVRACDSLDRGCVIADQNRAVVKIH